MIVDMLPTVCTLLFQGRMPAVRLSYLQVAILISIGLQRKDVDATCAELDLPANQVLAFFNKTMRKIATYLRELVEANTAKEMLPAQEKILRMEKRAAEMGTVGVSLAADQEADSAAFKVKQQQKELMMANRDLSQHAIGEGKDVDLQQALERGMSKHNNNAAPKLVSVPKDKDKEKRLQEEKDAAQAAAAAASASKKDHKKDKDKDKDKDKKRRRDSSSSGGEATPTPVKEKATEKGGEEEGEKSSSKSSKKEKKQKKSLE
jgi:N-acetyltransferase 10